MQTFVKNTVLATMIGAALLSSLPMAASADDFSFGVIIGGGRPGSGPGFPPPPGRGFQGGDPGFRDQQFGDDQPGFDRRPRRDNPDVYVRPRGGCNPDEAVDIARDYGLRHPRVISADRRKVVVEGRKGSGRARIIFGNAPGCPVAYR